jgi:hypothetical protein
MGRVFGSGEKDAHTEDVISENPEITPVTRRHKEFLTADGHG